MLKKSCVNLEKITVPVNAEETKAKEPVDITVEWSEKLFGEKSAFYYNHTIARMACILSEVSYLREDDLKDACQLKSVYRVLGIKDENMEFHYDIDYSDAELGKNQAAFSFAIKEISSSKGKANLVFVTVRGTPLQPNEWVSNLNVSDTVKTAAKYHEGFYIAERQVHTALMYFLLKKQISPFETFFLITGHSRGGAITNLLGADLADSGIFDTEKLYTYTFASPNVSIDDSTEDKKYNFIWNIVNPEDVAPTVPFCRGNWKYRKFGQIKAFTTRWNLTPEYYENEFYPKINGFYNLIMKRDYYPFTTGTFIPSAITKLVTSIFPDVEKYYGKSFGFRNSAEKIIFELFPKSDAQGDEDFPKTIKIAEKILNNKYNRVGEVLDYSSYAFFDMHICSAYLSWMLSFNEEELFSVNGSSRLILKGVMFDAEILDSKGEVMAKINNGIPQFESVKLPVILVPSKDGITIGFPSSEEYSVVIRKENLVLPIKMTCQIEHYDYCGFLIESCPKIELYPQAGEEIKFIVGSRTLSEDKVVPFASVKN